MMSRPGGERDSVSETANATFRALLVLKGFAAVRESVA
jgi:hypothetical protein